MTVTPPECYSRGIMRVNGCDEGALRRGRVELACPKRAHVHVGQEPAHGVR